MFHVRPPALHTISALATCFVGFFAATFLTGCGDTSTCDGCPAQVAPAPDWKPLITGDWSLAPGMEDTQNVHTLVIDRDIYIGGLRPIDPVGTHHALFALSEQDYGTGNYAFGYGVGTNELVFPKGMGLKISAGQTIVLELHIINTSAGTLAQTSGLEFIEIAASDIEHEVSTLGPGATDFLIPPNQKYTKVSTCTIDATQTIFAIWPHMHTHGRHLKSTLTIGGKQQVLYDDAFSFEQQKIWPFAPITLNPGDVVTTECTWENTTAENVTFGPRTKDEMCAGSFYRYPALLNKSVICQQ